MRRGSISALCDPVWIAATVIMGVMLLNWWCFGILHPLTRGNSSGDSSRLASPEPLFWSQQIPAFDSPVRRSLGSAKVNPRVLLISARQSHCPSPPDYNSTILKSLRNKSDYSRRHAMDTWFSLELLEVAVDLSNPHSSARNKVLLLLHIMRDQPSYDWYIWMNTDVLIMDLSFRIPWEEYRGYSLVTWGDAPSLDSEPDFSRSLNTGVILFRNDFHSRDFFDSMVQLWDSYTTNQTDLHSKMKGVIAGMPDFVCDQGTALYLLVTQKERWIPHVYVEERYLINQDWHPSLDDLDNFLEPGTRRGDGTTPPFMVRFRDCFASCLKNSTRKVTVTMDFKACQKRHERAFIFAENQVIREIGLREQNMSTSEVVPTN